MLGVIHYFRFDVLATATMIGGSEIDENRNLIGDSGGDGGPNLRGNWRDRTTYPLPTLGVGGG